MTKAVVTVEMFNLPNFMRIKAAGPASRMLDVAELFPTDQEAREFWMGCIEDWVRHVEKRRNAHRDTGGRNADG